MVASTSPNQFVAFTVHVRWDPNIFSLSGGSVSGGILDPATQHSVCPQALADPDDGGISLSCALYAPSTTTGGGLLASIVLAPIAVGCSYIHLLTPGSPDNAGSGATITVNLAETLQADSLVDRGIDQDGADCSPPIVQDVDHDGVPDGLDDCAAVFNPSQANTDGESSLAGRGGQDDLGDACDNNISGDGYTNAAHTALGKDPKLYCLIMRADMNDDGAVNGLDLNMLGKSFLQSYTHVDPSDGVDTGLQRIDQNGDLAVNGLDLNMLGKRFLQNVAACP